MEVRLLFQAEVPDTGSSSRVAVSIARSQQASRRRSFPGTAEQTTRKAIFAHALMQFNASNWDVQFRFVILALKFAPAREVARKPAMVQQRRDGKQPSFVVTASRASTQLHEALQS
jgi:hypothetical protein